MIVFFIEEEEEEEDDEEEGSDEESDESDHDHRPSGAKPRTNVQNKKQPKDVGAAHPNPAECKQQ